MLETFSIDRCFWWHLKHKVINLWARWKTTSLLISTILFIFFFELVVRLKLNFISLHSSEKLAFSEGNILCSRFVRSFVHFSIYGCCESLKYSDGDDDNNNATWKKPHFISWSSIESTNLYKLLFPSSDYIYYLRPLPCPKSFDELKKNLIALACRETLNDEGKQPSGTRVMFKLASERF